MKLLKKILAVNLSIFLLAALIILAVAPLTPAVASPLGVVSTQFNGYVYAFEWNHSSCLTIPQEWDDVTETIPSTLACPYYIKSGQSQGVDTVRIYCDNSPENTYASFSKSLFSWDTSAIPDDAIITGARVKFRPNQVSMTATGSFNSQFYWFTGTADGTYAVADWGKFIKGDPGYCLKTSIVPADLIEDEWTAPYEFNAYGLYRVNKTGYTVFWCRPVIEAIGGVYRWEIGRGGLIDLGSSYGTGEAPVLEVDYIGGIAIRAVDKNTNAGEGGAGNDLTAITWQTPRCVWNDETPGFLITGEAGCPFDVKITNGSLTIASLSEQVVKVDGNYYWYPDLGDYAGKFRCEAWETTSGHTDKIISTWGYSQEFAGSRSCISQVKYMEEDILSWTRAESEFRIASTTELLTFYWTSDMIEGDIATCELDIMQGGATRAAAYNSTLVDLLDDYYECDDADNDNLISSRYILASMGTVSDDLDGLIIDLSKSLINANKGFYYAQISNDGVSALTPVSAYLYYDTGEFKITKSYSDGTYEIGIANNVNIGLQSNLEQILITVTGADGFINKTVTDLLDSSVKTVEFDFVADGQYMAKLELWSAGEDFRYIRLWNDSLKSGEEEGGGGGLPGDWSNWWDWLMTAAGRWVLLIICIGLETLIFRDQKGVAIILGLCFVALWIVLSWVDIWLVVLLALGAGLTIWAMLRRKTQGGGNE